MAAGSVETLPRADVRERPARGKDKGYGKTAKVGAVWGVVREAVTQVLGFPTMFILARLLTPADFGIAAAATFFIQLGKRMGNMGLNTALVRMKEVREEHRASVFVINLAFGVCAWAGLMAVAPAIGDYYNDSRVTGALRLASTIFLVNFFGAVEYAVLQRDMRFKEMAMVEWVAPICFFPVSVGMALSGYGYWSLLVGHLVANSASTAAKVYYGRWRFSLAATRRGLAETVPFGMGIYAKRLLTYAAENLDSLIVGGLFGVTSLGFYDKAYNAVDTMSQRLHLGAATIFRIFAVIQDERERFIRAYNKVVLAGTIVTLPVFAGLIVAAPEFIVVAFGHQWTPAVLPFQLLCAGGALRLLGSYASAAVQASGRVWGEVWRKVAQVVLIVGLIYLLRPWGIEGAAFAVLAATLVLTVLMQGLVGKIVGLTWREMLTPLVPPLLAAGLTGAVVGAVSVAMHQWAPQAPAWLRFAGQAGIGGVAWVAFIFFVRFPAMQAVIDEVLEDVVPAVVRRPINRLRGASAAAPKV